MSGPAAMVGFARRVFVGRQHRKPLGSRVWPASELQDVADLDPLPGGGADELCSKGCQFGLPHRIRDTFKSPDHLYGRQLAQSCVVEPKTATDLTIDTQLPALRMQNRIAAGFFVTT